MKKLVFVAVLLLLFLTTSTYAIYEPSQSFNKIFLNPFYRVSTVRDTNYVYNVTVNPPDKIARVNSAIITFKVYMTPTVTFNLTIGGKSCNNPTYVVSTTYSSSGQGEVTFDCSNIINGSGTYNMILRPTQANTGAITGWLDITYMNNPGGELNLMGTEYIEGDDGTVFLQLRDADGVPIQNATCYLNIYYPAAYDILHPKWLNNGMMLYLENGIYYYDFTVPSYPGLYMTDASCTYTTQNNYYYTLGSGKSTTRNVTLGIYTGDTFVLNDYSEWLYTQCDSATGGTKACDVYYTWQIDKNASQTFDMSVVYLGESGSAPTMTVYYWNWTSGAWVALSNTLTFKATASGGVPSGVDEYLANKIPVTDATINAALNNSVRVRFYSVAGAVFKQYDNWINLVVSETSTAIQDLRGSGEVHVSAPSSQQSEARFYKITSCDGFIDGRCALLTNDGEFDLAEGELEDWVNITAVSTQGVIPIEYYSPFSVDCTALYWIKTWNGSAWVDFEDYSLYSQPALENCEISLNTNITSGNDYQYWLKFDNYMKWEVDWTRVMMDAVYEKVDGLCADRGFNYTNPITETSVMPNDTITRFCYEAYDDMYWSSVYYNDSLLTDNAGEYASYVQSIRYYRAQLFDRYYFLLLGNNTDFMSDYYARKTWTYPVRNLTYYEHVDMTDYTKVQDYVWNATNRTLTYYPPASVDVASIWSYSNRSLTYYADMTNYTYIFNKLDLLFDDYLGVQMEIKS